MVKINELELFAQNHITNRYNYNYIKCTLKTLASKDEKHETNVNDISCSDLVLQINLYRVIASSMVDHVYNSK